MSTVIANTYGAGYTAPADSAPGWAEGTGFDVDPGTQGLGDEAAIKADTLDIAQDYVNADVANRERLVRAILGDVVTTMTAQELNAIEQLVKDALNEALATGAQSPQIKLVDHSDIDPADLPGGVDDSYLPTGVEGAFITPEEAGTDGGVIFLSKELLADPERLGEVALEELGEALAVHVAADGILGDYDLEVADGDVGARISSTIQEERIEDETWDDSAADTTVVAWQGHAKDAKAAETAEATDAELAAEWGVDVATVELAMSAATQIYDRQGFGDGAGFTFGDHDKDGWDQIVRVYADYPAIGAGDQILTVDQFAHAIADGAVETHEAETGDAMGEHVIGVIDTTQVSDIAVVDAIWTYLEVAEADGEPKQNIGIEMLDSGIAHLAAMSVSGTGGSEPDLTTGLANLGEEHYAAFQELFANITVGEETSASRFTKDAVRTIFGSGVLEQVGFDYTQPVSTAISGEVSYAVDNDALATLQTMVGEGDAELAAEWGVGVGAVAHALNVAPQIATAPWTETSFPLIENWPLVVETYGTGGELSELEMAEAIAQGAVLVAPTGGTEHGFTVESVFVSEAVIAGADSGDTVSVDDGVWYGFGYYGDEDGDAALNGSDPDATVASYDLVDFPADVDLPAGAELTPVYDMEPVETYYNGSQVRALRYVDPTTSAEVAQLIDMSPDSATYGQTLLKSELHTDGSVSSTRIGEPSTAVITAEEMEAIEADNAASDADAGRRLGDGFATEAQEELENFVLDTVPGAVIQESFGHNNIAWVNYEDADGNVHIKFKYAHVVVYPDGTPKRLDPVYGDIEKDGAGWDYFVQGADIMRTLPGLEDEWVGATENTFYAGGFAAISDWATGGGMNLSYSQASDASLNSKVMLAGEAVMAFFKGLKATAQSSVAVDSFGMVIDQVETSDTIEGTAAAVADEDDLGVVGLDRPAYFTPVDAVVLNSRIVPAESGPYGVDTEEFIYTRPGEDNTVYAVSTDASDPGGARDGLVLQATKTFIEEVDGTTLSDVTTYDSFGTATDTKYDLELESVLDTITEEELLGDDEAHAADQAHAAANILELHPDAVILTSQSVGPVTFVSYEIPGETGTRVHMLDRVTSDDGINHYEEADGWLNSPVVLAFLQGFSYLQSAAQDFMLAKNYVDQGLFTVDVLTYLLQNIDLPSLASMFSSSGTHTDLTPQETATVSHTITIAGLMPLIQSGLVIGAEWAMLNAGATDYALAGNCLNRAQNVATGDTDNVVNLGNQSDDPGDIEAPSVDEVPAPDPVPEPPENTESGATRLLVRSVNPDDMCAGVAEQYLKSRLETGIIQESNSQIKRAATVAAPIENGQANEAARQFSEQKFDEVVAGLSTHGEYFDRMADPNDTSVVDFLSPAGQNIDNAGVLGNRYMDATAMAIDGFELKFEPPTTVPSDVVEKINAEGSTGKAFLLNMDINSGDVDVLGHSVSVVKELDGSVTLMDAAKGLLRFKDEPSLSFYLENMGDNLVYQLSEVKSGQNSDMPASTTQMLDWYEGLTGVDARNYGS